MGISLKTHMQMLGLSNPKMFSLFLRITADRLPGLGDLKERASRVWERAGSGGRGTRHIGQGQGTAVLRPALQTIPSGPLTSCKTKLTFQEPGMRMQSKARGRFTNVLAVALPVGGQLVAPGCSIQERKRAPNHLNIT